MRFERVRLENFKCYADADLRLDPGVTVVHGLNGSGKSSLLEACFFALYGATALDRTLEEVVTLGAEEATVELWFTHGGGDYHVERRVTVREERAQTATCVLETPEETFEGARDVRAHVGELLRMDADAFVNCAYVRQGEVNKLINATPGERQDMIDDLLQLGKLEAYRERASDARLGVKSVRDDRQGSLAQLDAQIEEKEDKDLHARLNDLESDLAEVTERIDHLEAQRETAVQTREEAESVLEEYEDNRERIDELAAAVEELRTEIRETEHEREEIGERVADLRERIAEREATLEDRLAATDLEAPVDPDEVADAREALEAEDEERRERIEEHRLEAQELSSTAETHAEAASDLEERAEEKREEAAALESDLEEREATLAERRERLADLDDEIEERRGSFEDAPVDPGGAEAHREALAEEREELRTEEADLRADLEAAREAVEEAEELLEAGNCPACGQAVEGAPHVSSLAEDRERVARQESELSAVRDDRAALEERLDRAAALCEAERELERLRSERSNVAALVEERSDDLAEQRERVGTLRERAEELEAEAAERREAAAEAEEGAAERCEAIAALNRERGDLGDRIERLEAVEADLESLTDLEGDLESLRERRDRLEELNEERRERLADKRERKADLEERYDEERVEHARNERERAAAYIEQVDGTLAELTAERDDLQSAVGGVRNEIEELEALRERREELASTLERLESLYEEAEDLQTMYGDLRAELRSRNVRTLERMLNETFELVYGNDAYSRIELDGEYALTVYQKDGEPLDPQQLSGGERALFNLSLRCAIYRLLAEGIEGAAPMPPLILDEPTVFLDSGHVSRLVELVEAMRELGVEQIVVVSHDDELVGAADHVVTVRKDPVSNRSSVEREAEPSLPREATRAD